MADPYRYNPFGKGQDAWYTRNNDYGYSPPQQGRLSDLAYQQQPRQASRMFTNLPVYQGQPNTTFIPEGGNQYSETPYQSYSRPLPQNYEVLTNGGNTKYMDEGTYNNYMGAIDSAGDSYSQMDAYRRLMSGLR